MSSLDALSIASSSLIALKQQLGVVAQNIGNAQTSTYSQENVVVNDQNGNGSGITVSVQRAVSTVLQNEVLSQTTSNGGAALTSQIYSQLENLTGASSDSPVLTQAVTALVTAFQAYQSSPENATAQQGVTNAASNLVNTLQSVSSGVTQLQEQTKTGLSTDVKALNSTLTKIQQINSSITQATAQGQPVGGLQDQRDQLIATVANLTPIRQQQNSDGSVSLFTPDGVALVDGSVAAQFVYTPPSSTSSGATTAGTISNANDPNATALNGSFGGGQIGAELSALRTDTAAVSSSDPSLAPLAKLQNQINFLAEQFYGQNSSATPADTPGTAFQQAFNGAALTAQPTAATSATGNNSLFILTDPTATTFSVGNLTVNANAITNLTSSDAANVVTQLTSGQVSLSGLGGDIPGQTTTLANLPQLFVADQSGRAGTAANTAQSASTALSTTNTNYRSNVGVSLDQQLSLMVVLQNSYDAAAKVISTINQLQQTLFNAA